MLFWNERTPCRTLYPAGEDDTVPHYSGDELNVPGPTARTGIDTWAHVLQSPAGCSGHRVGRGGGEHGLHLREGESMGICSCFVGLGKAELKDDVLSEYERILLSTSGTGSRVATYLLHWWYRWSGRHTTSWAIFEPGPALSSSQAGNLQRALSPWTVLCAQCSYSALF